MSYCRWSEESDIYLYPSVEGPIVCCGCSISPGSQEFSSYAEVSHHLAMHVKAGDKVPEHVLQEFFVDAFSSRDRIYFPDVQEDETEEAAQVENVYMRMIRMIIENNDQDPEADTDDTC